MPSGARFPRAVGPFNIFSTGVGFSGPLFDLTLYHRLLAARATESASKADSLSTREQVILLVVSQYIGTLRAVADVQASQSRVDLAQALYDQAADLQKEGVGTGIDTLRANVELQNEKLTMPSFSLMVEAVTPKGTDAAMAMLQSKVYFPHLPRQESLRQRVPVTFPRRGVYRQDTFRIVTRFPFGFLQKARRLDLAAEALVVLAAGPQ